MRIAHLIAAEQTDVNRWVMKYRFEDSDPTPVEQIVLGPTTAAAAIGFLGRVLRAVGVELREEAPAHAKP